MAIRRDGVNFTLFCIFYIFQISNADLVHMWTLAVFWAFWGYLGAIWPLLDLYSPPIWLNTRVTNLYITDNVPLAPADPWVVS